MRTTCTRRAQHATCDISRSKGSRRISVLHGRKHTRGQSWATGGRGRLHKKGHQSGTQDGAGRKVIAKQDKAQDACTRGDDNMAANVQNVCTQVCNFWGGRSTKRTGFTPRIQVPEFLSMLCCFAREHSSRTATNTNHGWQRERHRTFQLLPKQQPFSCLQLFAPKTMICKHSCVVHRAVTNTTHAWHTERASHLATAA